MQRSNPNIPLSVQQRDFSSPLTRLNDQAREDQLIQQQQQRQAVMDQSTLATQETTRNRNNQAIGANKQAQQMANIQKVTMDTVAAIELLRDGKKGPAGALLISSIDTMKSMEMDTSQAETYAGLAAVDPEAALKYADEEMLPLIRAQHSKIFPEEERIPNSELVKDPATGRLGTVTQSGGFQRVEGAGAAPADTDSVNNQIVQYQLPNGDEGSGFLNPRTLEISDSSGKPLENQDGVRFSGSSITGANGDVITPSAQTKLMASKSFTRNLVNNLTEMRTMLEGNQDAGTLTARASSFVGNVKAEGRALARNLGVEFDESNFQPGAVDEATWNDLGIDSSVLRSLAIGAAYSLAASDNDGRVSGPDFDAALSQIGGDLADPEQRIAVIDSVINRKTKAFTQDYKDIMGEDFEGDFGVQSQGQGGDARASFVQEAIAGGLTPEEAAELYDLENQ